MEHLPLPIPSDAAIQAVLQHRVDDCGLSPGMVVGISQDGIRRFHYRGVSGPSGTPADASTVFEIGSVTRLFTCLVLVDMVLHGDVALDEPVSALLPTGTRVPDRNGKPITLLHLATHTAGLPRVPSDLEVNSPTPYAGYTTERLYAFLANFQLARTPGEVVEYSNLGAGLLGHALALRAGQTYEELLATRILHPLGMASTKIDLTDEMTARSATAHDDSGEPVATWDFGVLAGAGGLRSTATDVLLFLEALMDVDAGPIGAAAGLLAAQRDVGGLGFGLPQAEGHVALQHEGGTAGFRSYAGCVPAWRRGAVVLANASTGACADLGIHLCDPRWALQWHRQPIAIDPACLDRLAGRYRMRPGVLIDVMHQRDRLIVQLSGQPPLRVFPLSEWEFFYKVVGAQITFEPGPDGRAARLILHQNSRDQTADRLE